MANFKISEMNFNFLYNVDRRYFYSWLPTEKYNTYNGRPWYDPVTNKNRIVWFNTYPLEYCEFLLDSALRRNVYLHILSANDAYYERHALPPSEVDDEKDKVDSEEFLGKNITLWLKKCENFQNSHLTLKINNIF